MTPNLPISLDSDDKMKAADQKFCFSCGAVLHHSANACPKCGAAQPVQNDAAVSSWRPHLPTTGAQSPAGALPPNHVYCRGCGGAIHETASTCPKCGAQQRVSGSGVVGRKDRVTAAVLAILLGSFGAHRFYLGHIGLGFLYLLFFWTWIPGIVGLIEGIIYLTNSDEEFNAKYG